MKFRLHVRIQVEIPRMYLRIRGRKCNLELRAQLWAGGADLGITGFAGTDDSRGKNEQGTETVQDEP